MLWLLCKEIQDCINTRAAVHGGAGHAASADAGMWKDWHPLTSGKRKHWHAGLMPWAKPDAVSTKQLWNGGAVPLQSGPKMPKYNH